MVESWCQVLRRITCHRMLPSLLVVGAAVSLLDPSCHAGGISTAAGTVDARQHPWRALGCTDQSSAIIFILRICENEVFSQLECVRMELWYVIYMRLSRFSSPVSWLSSSFLFYWVKVCYLWRYARGRFINDGIYKTKSWAWVNLSFGLALEDVWLVLQRKVKLLWVIHLFDRLLDYVYTSYLSENTTDWYNLPMLDLATHVYPAVIILPTSYRGFRFQAFCRTTIDLAMAINQFRFLFQINSSKATKNESIQRIFALEFLQTTMTNVQTYVECNVARNRPSIICYAVLPYRNIKCHSFT